MLLDDNFTPRLVDFGLVSAVGDLPEALAYLHTTARQPGAIRWAAPEHFLVGDIKRTTKGDIYSLGNIIFLASPPSITRTFTLIFSRCCRENSHGRKYVRIMR